MLDKGRTDAEQRSRLSLSQRIYATVRERIILGQYPQGSRVLEQRIGEELDVSRVPLREAVPLLERDGFVHSYPRRGAVVARWDTKAIDDLFDARLSLEVVAAGYAARQVRGRRVDGAVEPYGRKPSGWSRPATRMRLPSAARRFTRRWSRRRRTS